MIEIPGHTPGSIAVLDVKFRRLFSGDAVQNGHIFMFGIQREMHAYRHSLLRLQKYAGSFDEVYPSHAACPVKPKIIMKLYDAAGRILDGTVAGSPGEMHGKAVTVYEPGPAVFLCDAKK